MTEPIKHYVSVYAEFDTIEESAAFLQENVLPHTIPNGGKVFSYSLENESTYRDGGDILLKALQNAKKSIDIACGWDRTYAKTAITQIISAIKHYGIITGRHPNLR